MKFGSTNVSVRLFEKIFLHEILPKSDSGTQDISLILIPGAVHVLAMLIKPGIQ